MGRLVFRIVDGLALLSATGGGYLMVRCFRDLARGDAPLGDSMAEAWPWLLLGIWGGMMMAAGISMYWRQKWSRWFWAVHYAVGFLLVQAWWWQGWEQWENGTDPGGELKFWFRLGLALLLLGSSILLFSPLGSKQFEIEREKNW